MTSQERRQKYLNRREDVGVAIIDEPESYLYRPRQLILRGDENQRSSGGRLVTAEFSARVQPMPMDMLPGDQVRPGPGSPPAQPGRLRRLDIDPTLRSDRYYLPPGMDPREAIERLGRSEAVEASVNHLFFGEQYWAGEPASRPEPASQEDLPAFNGDDGVGAGVKLGILDTGIDRYADRHPSLQGRSVITPDDVDMLDGDRNGYLDHEAGHGTHVAGVIMRHAPAATFLSYAVLDPAGVGDEISIANAITEAASDGCQIINMSLGGYTLGDKPPRAIWDALDALSGTEVVVVAAAGNAFESKVGERPFWPAAFAGKGAGKYPWVVAVAAGKSGTHLAPFSNRAPWVTCRANGEDVVSTYVRGTWDPSDGGARGFSGYARWSGTSFSTPRVAAAIAAQMNSTTPSARDALEKVLSESGRRTVTVPVDNGGVFIS